MLAWAVRVLTDLETQMMSVERVSELINPDGAVEGGGSVPVP